MNLINKTFTFLIAGILLLGSCTTVDLYEKTVLMPGHSWKSDFKPSFSFAIKDTTAEYQLYIVLRHNDRYSFNNIYLNLYTQAPGEGEKKVTLDLPLATNEKGWLASGMDDIYEHRIAFVLDPRIFNFKKAGTYNFRLEQIMREDPLKNVLNAGLYIEKKK
jgi:gliding motility-associated lipoprotein GldH